MRDLVFIKATEAQVRQEGGDKLLCYWQIRRELEERVSRCEQEEKDAQYRLDKRGMGKMLEIEGEERKEGGERWQELCRLLEVKRERIKEYEREHGTANGEWIHDRTGGLKVRGKRVSRQWVDYKPFRCV
jgi:hypothetical protein